MIAHLLPVGVFVCLLRESLESDALYSNLWLEGEISDLSRSAAGHVYFTLSDEDGCLKCVLFRREALRQSQPPKLGDQVAVHGGLSLYPKSGAMRLQVDLVRPAGLGPQSLELEYSRQRLEAEGLFDPSRKRPLPAFPRRIGVVTSPFGAAWHDVQTVIARRYPIAELVLSPAQVQGDGAAESIIEALKAFRADTQVDVIILARGGGGSDDLAAFNDERVVRAVYASRVPTVVGIGHATDRSLVEEVADVVAPTPSAAAEMCVPSLVPLGEQVSSLVSRLRWAMSERKGEGTSSASLAARRLQAFSPAEIVRAHKLRVASGAQRLRHARRRQVAERRASLTASSTLLAALDPAAVLKRGYATIQSAEDGRPIFSASVVEPGVQLMTTLQDGSFVATVDGNVTAASPSSAESA